MRRLLLGLSLLVTGCGDMAELNNGIWNQWIEPHAVRSGDVTYFGSIGDGGEVKIGAYDHTEEVLTSSQIATTEDDDHNAPAVLVDSSGHIWAFYSKHNTEGKLYYRRSANADSIITWDAEGELSEASNVTYAQAFETSSGRIIVFFRLGNNQWAFRYTDDDGSSWSSAGEVWLGTSSWIYQIMRQHSDPDVLSVAVGWHPDNASTHDIYLYHIDLDSGDVTSPDSATVHADIYDDLTLPMDPTDGLRVVQNATGETVRLWDVSEHDEIAFSTWDTSDMVATAEYHYVQVSSGGSVGTVRDLVAAGATVDDAANERGYFGGMATTDTEGEVLLARESSGDWTVERWTTADGGSTWSDTTLTSHASDATKKFRPAPVRGGSEAIWVEGGYTSFTDFSTDLFVEGTSAPAGHRHWRFRFTANNGASDYVSLLEAEFRSSLNGPDETGSGTASSTDHHVDYPPSQAFDDGPDDFTSRWLGELPFTVWLAYDFGTNVDVREVMLQAATGHADSTDRAPRDFDVQYSDNGSDWTTAWSVSGETGWSTTEERVFTDPQYDLAPGDFDYQLTASGDTYVRSGSSNSDDNFGTEDNLLVKTNSGSETDLDRHTLIQFDLSSISETDITDAALFLYQEDAEALEIDVFLCDEAWDEAEATWDDRLTGTPWSDGDNHAAGTKLGSFHAPGIADEEVYLQSELLVQAIQEAMDDGDPLRLVLKVTTESEAAPSFHSKEGSGTEPTLAVSAEGAATSPDTPTVEDVTATATGAEIEGSAYSHPDSTAQQARRFVVSENSDLSSPVYDETDPAPAQDHTVPAGTLDPETEYYAGIADQDADGEWSGFGTAPFETSSATPSDLSGAWDPDDEEIDLSWTPPDGATAQHVLRATTSGGSYTDLGDAGAAASSFSDETPEADAWNYYIIRATVDGDDYDSDEIAVYSGWYDDFSQDEAAAAPAGFTPIWDGATYSVVEDAGYEGGKYCREHESSTSTPRHVLRFDVVPVVSDPHRIVAICWNNTTGVPANQGTGVAFAVDDGGDRTAYVIAAVAGQIALSRFETGSRTELGSASGTATARDTRYVLDIDFDPDTGRIDVYAYLPGGSRGATPDISVVDPSPLSAGRVGFAWAYELYDVRFDSILVTEAELAGPETPTLTVTSVGQRDADWEASAYSHPERTGHDATHVEVRIKGDTELVVDEELGAVEAGTAEPLSPETTLQIRVGYEDADGATSYSAWVDFTTEASLLTVAFIDDTQATLVFTFTEDSTAVQYQVRLASSADDWSDLEHDATRTGDGLGFYIADGLTDETDYSARARERLADGTWGDWNYADFTTAAAPTFEGLAEFTAPRDFAAVTGIVEVEWDLDWNGRRSGWRPTLLESKYEDEDWVELLSGDDFADSASGSHAFDTAPYDDGILVFRMVGRNEDGTLEGDMFLTLVLNNDDTFDTVFNGMTEAEYEDSLIVGTKHTHSSWFTETYNEPMFGGSGEDGDGAIVTWGDVAVLPPDMQLEDSVTGFSAFAVARAIASGTHLWWWFNLQIEGAWLRIEAIDQFDNVLAFAETSIGSVLPIYPCPKDASKADDGPDLRGALMGRLRFVNEGRSGGGVQTIHSAGISQNAQGGWPGECSVSPGGFFVNFSMQPTGTPNVFTLSYRSLGGAVERENTAAFGDDFRHEEEVTFGQTDEGEDVCVAGFRIRGGPGPFWDPGFVAITGGGHSITGTDLCDPLAPPDEPPEEPPEIKECPEEPFEEPPLPPTPSQPCSVVLQVFEEDGHTVAWEVGTDPGHANPYLVEPDHYGEQEADFTEGSASIGQANAVVIDPARTAGDQDTGWSTEKLSAGLGRNAWGGRRHRLLRWVSEDTGWVVISDGPGGFPRLQSDYASYEVPIRDTRERERRTKIFLERPDQNECRPEAHFTTLVPRGVTADWGDIYMGDEEKAGVEYILPAVEPAACVYNRGGESIEDADLFDGLVTLPARLMLDAFHTGSIHDTKPPWLALSEPLAEMAEADVFEPTGRSSSTVDPDEEFGDLPSDPMFDEYRMAWTHLEVWWRYPGTSPETGEVHPWNREKLERDSVFSWAPTNLFAYLTHHWYLVVGYDENDEEIRERRTVIKDIPVFGRLGTYSGVNEPPHGRVLECMLVHVGEPSEAAPLLIETTAGQFLRDLYDGQYSLRHEDDSVVWTGVRYDRDVLEEMTNPVRLIVTDTEDDLRKWAEEHVYKPLGYVPAVDNDGRVSPVHQDPLESFESLTPLTDASIEPSPEWIAGDKVVNILEFSYDRTFVWDEEENPDPDMEHQNFTTLTLNPRRVNLVHHNRASLDHHGEHRWKADGRITVALGQHDPFPIHTLDEEYGSQVTDNRKLRIFDRLKWGAPVATLTCLRSETWDWRVGTWIRIQPSWLPDYISGERGADYYAQILAIRDLDCAWRQVTFELAAEEIITGIPHLTTSSVVGAGGGASVSGAHAAAEHLTTSSTVGAGGGASAEVSIGDGNIAELSTSSVVGAGGGASGEVGAPAPSGGGTAVFEDDFSTGDTSKTGGGFSWNNTSFNVLEYDTGKFALQFVHNQESTRQLAAAASSGSSTIVVGSEPRRYARFILGVDTANEETHYVLNAATSNISDNGDGTWTVTLGDENNSATTLANSHASGSDYQYNPDSHPAGQTFKELRFTPPPQQEVFFEFDLYVPDGDESWGGHEYEHQDSESSDNNKFWFLWSDDYTHYGTKAGLEGNPSGSPRISRARPGWGTNAAEGGRVYSNWGDLGNEEFIDEADRGTWVNFRFQLKISDTWTANGIWRGWKNGTLVIEDTGLDNGPEDGVRNEIDNGYLQGWWNSAPSEEVRMLFTNFKWYNSDPGWND